MRCICSFVVVSLIGVSATTLLGFLGFGEMHLVFVVALIGMNAANGLTGIMD